MLGFGTSDRPRTVFDTPHPAEQDRQTTGLAALVQEPHSTAAQYPQMGVGLYIFPKGRSEEHTSELQSLMRISYAVFCLNNKKIKISTRNNTIILIERQIHT